MSTYLPESLRIQIETADHQRCCYCLTSEANSGIPMTYDHIQPRSKGGDTSFENICLAYRSSAIPNSDCSKQYGIWYAFAWYTQYTIKRN